MKRAIAPIGLDVGRRVLKAAQCLPDGRVLTALVTRSELGLAEDLERVGSTLWRRGFRGRTVVASASEHTALQATVELPRPETGAPVRTIAAAELARLHGREAKGLETTVVYRDAPADTRPGRGAPAYVFAVEGDDVMADVAALEHGTGSLRVVRVEAGPVAMARALAFAWGPGAACAIEFGWSRLTVSASVGGVPIFVRVLEELGLSRLDEARGGASSVGAFFDRLSEELERSAVYGVREAGGAGPVPTLLATPPRALGPLIEMVSRLGESGTAALAVRPTLRLGQGECSGRFARAVGLSLGARRSFALRGASIREALTRSSGEGVAA
ncbi:MAG: hypothetical protein EA378_05440 [Phycisphaerales bacterium]|nr:MAG: hypothetical protein EA378_05440 [Phycisphaerales bacterium]